MRYFLLLFCFLMLAPLPIAAEPADGHSGESGNCRKHEGKRSCDSGPAWCKNEGSSCSPEMRGRCGKRRGDWYGARQPVNSATEAQTLLQSYFAGQDYTVSTVTEKKWGFKADILDRSGAVIDSVLIDKRSGRIRSIY